MTVDPSDEGRQEPGRGRWFEGHRLDVWVAPDQPLGPLAITAAVTAQPSTRKANVTAVVLRDRASPQVMTEDDAVLPARGWELRASGLWVDHVCEAPLEHWSYGLEAFALALDDPSDLLVTNVGHRVPLGWELEFEAQAPAGWIGEGEYRQLGTAHGLLLDADGQHEIEGRAVRTHWWGPEPPERVVVGDTSGTIRSEVWVPTRAGTWHQTLWGAGASSVLVSSSA